MHDIYKQQSFANNTTKSPSHKHRAHKDRKNSTQKRRGDILGKQKRVLCIESKEDKTCFQNHSKRADTNPFPP